MAFGFRYWMVYLPEFHRESFLLFVHNPAGSTKLRDHSGEKVRVLGQPTERSVMCATTTGRTRFEIAPHEITDIYYWHKETANHNSNYLPGAHSVLGSVMTGRPSAQPGTIISGRARRGSRRQLQDYVNGHDLVLTRAVIEGLPPRLEELGARIKWVSPVAQDNYTEYRDGDFLRAVEFGDYIDELAVFWPSGGPSWDALGVISDFEGKIRPGVILLEAKSHISEIYGTGCQASARSRDRIDSSLALAKSWLGVKGKADWTGPLYQSCNRLAHLYFIRERLKRHAWLVNLYFINDPIGPTDYATWAAELQKVKSLLGLSSPVPFTIDLFLPSLTSSENSDNQLDPANDDATESGYSVQADGPVKSDLTELEVSGSKPILAEHSSFSVWIGRWLAIARYQGPLVPDVSQRIEQAVQQWREPIPRSWQRGLDLQLLGNRYRRGDIDAPRKGEHAIEHEILCRCFDSVLCLGKKLLDGINAFPLVRDAGGARHNNVEADLFLLTGIDGEHHLFLCEVKDSSDNAWYAALESLRQMRLLVSNPESLSVFGRRNQSLRLPVDIPVTALVLAPRSFYFSPGKKTNAVEPALRLLARVRSELGIDARLAVWDPGSFEIKEFD